MGFYINPPNQTKEEFLDDHGIPFNPNLKATPFDFTRNPCLPVCLINNGAFTAAGIAYCQAELDAMLVPDGRPKKWFIVFKADLKPYYNPPEAPANAGHDLRLPPPTSASS